MSGLELIVAALAAGASAGLVGATNSAINDTYSALKNQLSRQLVGRRRALEVINSEVPDEDVLRRSVGEDLVECGAASDDEALSLAARLLQEIRSTDNQESNTYNVVTNNGAIGSFNAPVTISNRPDPPRWPAAD